MPMQAPPTSLTTPRGKRASFTNLFKGMRRTSRSSNGDDGAAGGKPSSRESGMAAGGAPAAAAAAPAAAAPGGWDGPQLGLLDIYGFESLEVNTLDQLCINFANEILQNQFNERIFVLEKRLYVIIAASWSSIPRPPQRIRPVLYALPLPNRLLTRSRTHARRNRRRRRSTSPTSSSRTTRASSSSSPASRAASSRCSRSRCFYPPSQRPCTAPSR